MAKSRSIGSIYAELSLKDRMTASLNKAAYSLAAFGKKTAKIGFGALAVGATAVEMALIAGTKHTLSMTDDLADLSAQTGVNIADMMILQQAYKDGGRAAEMAGKDIGKMQKAIVAGSQAKTDPFAAIGLSAKQLLTMSPAQQFNAIGAALMRMQNPAERTAKAMEIFGRGGMGLMTVFEGLPNAEKALGRMPELAQRFGAAMGEANDLIGHLPLKSDQFFMGFTAGIIGELLPNLEKIDNFDFTTMGENLGKAMASGMALLTDGTAWEMITLQAEKAFAKLQQSDIINGWAASINALLDFGARGENGGSQNFGESFDKYAEAGKSAIDDIQSRIDELNKHIANTVGKNLAAAAARSGKPNAATGDASSISQKVEPLYKDPARTSETMVNSYQQRGLNLDGGAQSRTESKLAEQTNVLKEGIAILRRMADHSLVASPSW